MQKLTQSIIIFQFRKNQGSALVGVISFSMIISIMGLGFFTVMGHRVNMQVDSFHATEAHYAAESGLLIGARYIRENYVLNGNTWPGPGTTIGPILETPLIVNNLEVLVNLSVLPAFNPPHMRIQADVYESGQAGNINYLKKTLVYNDIEQPIAGTTTLHLKNWLQLK